VSTLSIVHVIAGLNTGGAENSLVRLIDHQDRERFARTTVIALRRGGTLGERLRSAGAEVVVVEGATGLETLRTWRATVARLKLSRPGIIHGWMYNGNTAAVLLQRQAAPLARLFWNVRASLRGIERFPLRIRASIRLNAVLSRRAETIVYNSHAGRREHEAAGFNAGSSLVIDNGIDMAKVCFSTAGRSRVRSELAIGESVVLVCNLARLDPMKDHETLLRAAGLLKDTGCRFLLVGPGISASASLKGIIESLGLRERVVLMDGRDDVPDVLSAADIFCLSSYTEGMPNVVAEAMACGVPAVVTDVGDAARLVGDTGLVAPARDPGALAAQLRTMIEMAPEQRRGLGEVARQRIRNEFSLERMIRAYDALYSEPRAALKRTA
jgi:glycosyltransferase involved in cell wall biosynthesis